MTYERTIVKKSKIGIWLTIMYRKIHLLLKRTLDMSVTKKI